MMVKLINRAPQSQVARQMKEAHAKRVRLHTEKRKAQERLSKLEKSSAEASTAEYQAFRELVAKDPGRATAFLIDGDLYRAEGTHVVVEPVEVVR